MTTAVTTTRAPMAAGIRRRLLALHPYRALAGVILVIALFEWSVDDSPNRIAGLPLSAALLALLAGVLAIANVADRRQRPRLAAGLAAVVLTIVALVGGLLYPTRASSAFAALIAFALVLPHLRGRQIPTAAILATLAAAPLALTGGGVDALTDPLHHLDLILGAGGATGVLVLLLWSQRRETEALVRRYSTLVDDLPLGVFRMTVDGRFVDVNDALVRLLGYPDRATLLATPVAAIRADDARGPLLADSWSVAGPVDGEVALRRYDGTTILGRHHTRASMPPDGGPAWFEGAIEDITHERASRQMSERLAALVESADDSIIGTSLDGAVTSWNPAAERMYGWTAAEMLGRRATVLVPASRAGELADILARISTGDQVRSLETERLTRSGALLKLSLTVTPVRDAEGHIIGVSSIGRDVTERRRLESELRRVARGRQMILEALRHLAPGVGPAETAAAICRQIASTGWFACAGIFEFRADGVAVPVSVWSDDPAFDLAGLVEHEVGVLRARADDGPWIDRRTGGGGDLAYAPIESSGEVVAMLVAGTGPAAAVEIAELLPALVNFGAMTGPLLGPQLASRRDAEVGRSRLRRVIEERAFAAVLQPVVDLGSMQVLGYEALTRFSDGTPPDRVFAEAKAAGVGLELEAATLRMALASCPPLPPGTFIDLNVSPDMILAIEPLRTILAGRSTDVILEITEHDQVSDYDALRAALARFGGGIRLAVDDAGAGFSSLKHILELRPSFVKLDRGLVSGIDTDMARQGLIAGMRHFARSIDCLLVAEGVETNAERETLIELGVSLGQGYLFGRPVPAAQTAAALPVLPVPPVPPKVARPSGLSARLQEPLGVDARAGRVAADISNAEQAVRPRIH